MSDQLNGYDLSRSWFDFCFENPELINPNHTAIFFFAIEHCNRLGWKKKFGLPTQMAKDAIGISKHQTYIKYFNDLVEWGFFILVQKSTNQYSANIVSISNGYTKNGKALDKAIIRHGAKQSASIGQSTGQSNGKSNSPIDKPINQLTNDDEGDLPTTPVYLLPTLINISKAKTLLNFDAQYGEHARSKTQKTISQLETFKTRFFTECEATSKLSWQDERNLKQHFISWVNKQPSGPSGGVYTGPVTKVIDHSKLNQNAH